MPEKTTPTPRKRLKKELRLLDVYAVATGATLSSGFFLLPGPAAGMVGPAVVLAYLIAAIPLIPATFSMVELATAMPRAGGVYYFLDRTLGPLAGTIGGIGTWLALVLKVAFALVGMGAYIALYFPNLEMTTIAAALALALGVLNYFGAKKTGVLQIVLACGLLTILAVFIGGGLTRLNPEHFVGFASQPLSNLLSTAGLVYISYVGVTNVASLSEEVADPERNLPLGMFLALLTALVVYGLGITVMVGLESSHRLANDLTPVATAAGAEFGDIGAIVVSIAAFFAFISVANAGMLSASRYPLAMSRDHLVPRALQRIGRTGTPVFALAITLCSVLAIIVFLDPTGIAKLASSFQLFMFALVCVAVIVMRESGLRSYDPGYRSPLYPWMQIFGVLASSVLLFYIGGWSLAFTVILVAASTCWYFIYGRKRVLRTGAIFHVFERWGRQRHEGLDHELRSILREKGLRAEDDFEALVSRGLVIDLHEGAEFEDVVDRVAHHMADHTEHTQADIRDQLLERTHMGATPVTHGVGLPHLWIEELAHPEIVLVRSTEGMHIQFLHPITNQEEDQRLHAIYFLFSPEDDPSRHLRTLAQIAERVDDDTFIDQWMAARNEQELKEVLLHDDRFLSLALSADAPSFELVGHALRELSFPEGCLVAMVRRNLHVYVPRGSTVLEEGDSLTFIGDSEGLEELRARFVRGEHE